MSEASGTGEKQASQALKVSSVRELAASLGLSKSQAHRWSKEPWFPSQASDGTWSLLEVRKAIAARSAPEKPSNPLIAHAEAQKAAAVLPVTNDADRQTLADAKDPLEIARAAARLASRATAAPTGLALVEALESLKRTLAELRMCEADFLELAKKKGEVIERDVAKVCMGKLSARFVLALERLETRLAGQVELWVSGNTLPEAPEDRSRVVRKWIVDQTAALRTEESSPEARAALEAMIQAEIEERKKA